MEHREWINEVLICLSKELSEIFAEKRKNFFTSTAFSEEIFGWALGSVLKEPEVKFSKIQMEFLDAFLMKFIESRGKAPKENSGWTVYGISDKALLVEFSMKFFWIFQNVLLHKFKRQLWGLFILEHRGQTSYKKYLDGAPPNDLSKLPPKIFQEFHN